MNDQDLEQRLRSLAPAPLPAELRERLAEEPAVELPRKNRRMRWAIAAGIIAAAGAGLLSWPDSKSDRSLAETDDAPFSVVQQEAVLLSTRTVETREHNGHLWELVENRWREDTVGMCSATEATIRSSEIRPEYVGTPVTFY